MMTDMHVDPASTQPDLDLDGSDGDLPEGSIAFDITAQDIADVLSAPSDQARQRPVGARGAGQPALQSAQDGGCPAQRRMSAALHGCSRLTVAVAARAEPMLARYEAWERRADALCAQLDALEDVEVPPRLIPAERVQAMQAQYQPRFVPLARVPAHAPMSANDPRPPADPVTGAGLCTLLAPAAADVADGHQPPFCLPARHLPAVPSSLPVSSLLCPGPVGGPPVRSPHQQSRPRGLDKWTFHLHAPGYAFA